MLVSLESRSRLPWTSSLAWNFPLSSCQPTQSKEQEGHINQIQPLGHNQKCVMSKDQQVMKQPFRGAVWTKQMGLSSPRCAQEEGQGLRAQRRVLGETPGPLEGESD